MRELLHHVGELREQVVRIMGTGRGFGVVLHAEERQFFVAHAFVGVVVEIDVSDFHIAGRQRFGIDAESVILRGDFDFLGDQILHGMIGTMMPELQFESLAAQRQPAQLVTEADAKNGHAAHQLSNIFDRVADGLRITGAIREEDAVRLEGENIFSRRLRGDNPNIAVMIDEQIAILQAGL